jgi:two-component system OmpR family response regulator
MIEVNRIIIVPPSLNFFSLTPLMRMLVVEDDPKIASFIVKGFKQSGFAVDQYADGAEGLSHALDEPYDVVVLDIMLPSLDGLSVVQKIREKKILTPVLLLSAKGSVDDRVKGLRSGGDDYVTKPFSFVELLARVEALVRRSSRTAEPTSVTVADLSLDLQTRKVTRNGKAIDLQAREFALLEYLMRNAGRVVTKNMILGHIWDYAFEPQTNVVDVLVCRLRNKVDKGFEPQRIKTQRGLGYILEVE